MPLHLSYPARQNNAAPAFTLDMNKRVQLLQKLAFSQSNPAADAVMAQELLKDVGAVYGLDFLSEEARANRRDLPSLPEREKDEIRMEMQILASREVEPTHEEIWQAFEDAFNRHESHRLESGKFHSKALRIFGENAGAFTDGALQSVPLYQKLKEALDIDEDKDLTDENVNMLMEKADQLIGVVTDAASGDFSADDIKELLGVSVMSTDVLHEMSLQLTKIKSALISLRAPVKQAGRHGDQWKRDEAKKIFHAFGAATAIAAKTALNTALPETNAAKVISFAADALTADSDDKEWMEKRVEAASASGKKADAIIENWEADTRLSALSAVTHKEREQRRRAKHEQATAVLERLKNGENDFSIAERGLLHALSVHGIRDVAELGTADSISAALRGVPYFSFVRDADGNLARMIKNPDGEGYVFRDPLMTQEQCAESVSQMYPQEAAQSGGNAENKDILADHAKGVAEEVKGNLLEKAYESMLTETAAKAAGSFLTTESLSNIHGRFDHKRALRRLTLKEKDYLEKRKTFSKIAKEAQVRVLLDKIAANETLSDRERALAADLDTLGVRSAQDLKQHDALLAVQVMESPHFAVRAKDNSVLSGLPDAVMSAKETQIRNVLAKSPRDMTDRERALYDSLKKIGVRKLDDLADNKFGTKIKKLSLACELDDAHFECRNGKVVMQSVSDFNSAEEYRAVFLGKYIAPAHILLTHEDKRESVKAYEEERLLITLERVGERQLAVAKAREIEMQQEKMQTRDKREAQALAVLEKAAYAPDKLQNWEKVLLIKLNQADVRSANDMSVKGGAVGTVNRDFIRRGMPSFNAEPLVKGGFETLNETQLSPCEKKAFAQRFDGKAFVRAARARKAEIKAVKPVENVKTPEPVKEPEKVVPVPPAPSPTPPVSPTPAKEPEKVMPVPPAPPVSPTPAKEPEKVMPVPPALAYAQSVFAKAEANRAMSEPEQVFLGAALAYGVRSAEDLKNPDALQILNSGMGGALNGVKFTPEKAQSLKFDNMQPTAAHALMTYMANRANLPALREAQAKGVLKKAARNEPMCEWEYALCQALNANDIRTPADLEIEDCKQIARDGMGLTCGGYDRLSVDRLPRDLKQSAKDGLAAVRDGREQQARAVLQKMQNHEKLAGAEIVLSAMLASSGIDGVDKLADGKNLEAVRNGLPDSFVRIGYSEDFSRLDASKMPPEAAHATMMYMEAANAQKPQESKADILKKYADAMARVDIYERTVELPRELARKKQASVRMPPLAQKTQNAR